MLMWFYNCWVIMQINAFGLVFAFDRVCPQQPALSVWLLEPTVAAAEWAE